jgi:hypothetical protein
MAKKLTSSSRKLPALSEKVFKASMKLYRQSTEQIGPYAGDAVLHANERPLREWLRACRAVDAPKAR